MGFGRRMDGCGNCMKYSMFIINFVIFIGGVVLVGLGTWTLVDKSFANELLGTNLYAGTIYVLIATGALVLLISCFGCLGAIKEVRCFLVTYFIAVFLIFVTMMIGGILGYVFREKVDVTLMHGMHSSMSNYKNYKPVTVAWDETQSRLHCCGVTSPNDWKDNLPDSCCKMPFPGKNQNCNLLVQNHNRHTLYMDGCYNVTKDFLKSHAVIVGSAGIVVACLMVLGMIFSCALYKMIDDD